MNKRFRELAEQAGLDFESYDRYGLFNEEYFAELIVRECCNMVSDEVECVNHFDNQHPVVARLKEHFGVE